MKTKKQIVALSLLSCALACTASAAENDQQVKIKKVMQRAADWQIVHFEDTSKTIRKGKPRHHELDWTHGALYVGMVKWAELSDDPAYYAWLKAIGDRNDWKLYKRKYFADDHTVLQMYCDLSRHFNDPKMIEASKAQFDDIIANPPKTDLKMGSKEWWNRWSWCDALFMAPPALVRLSAITGDQKYNDWMLSEYKATTDYLFDKEEGLYYRDSKYFDQRPHDKKVFWSRGNGWVFAGLAQMLSELPKDSDAYTYLLSIYKQMAESLLKLQTPEGHWAMSLLAAEEYPTPEASGTGFFCYGMAWGINNGILDKAKYEPATMKAWNALCSYVAEDGMLGYVQPIGASPGSAWPDKTEVYGVGAFLTAGSEIYQLVE